MTEDQFRKLLEENNKRQDTNLAKLFGQMSRHFDDRADADKAEINERFDALQTALDSLAKRTETDEQEGLAMESQLDRHNDWIGQLAKATNTRLVPEQ